MNNLGIIVSHINASQISYEAIKLANSAQDSIIFFEQLSQPCTAIRCATMCVNNLASFGGLLISTNIANTIMASEIVNRKKTKLIFYVWDLEWMRPNNYNYLYNRQAYLCPDELCVRSEDHVGPVRNYCGRTPLVTDFAGVTQWQTK